jgi:hypothetical protein
MEDRETFYLTTAGEYSLLARPRACRNLGRLSDHLRDDYMVVEISPPLIGQPFGLGGQDICRLVLATRHQGHTLFPIDEWPAHVYVTRLRDGEVAVPGFVAPEQIELIAWGQLFPNYEEAEREALQYPGEMF